MGQTDVMIVSGSFLTLEMEDQVKCIALWDALL